MFYVIFRAAPHMENLYFFCFIFSDPFTREIMKEFHNTDPLFKEYKYAYGEPEESKKIFLFINPD